MNRILKNKKNYRKVVKLLGLLLLASPGAYAVNLPSGMPDGGCWSDPLNIVPVRLTIADFPFNTIGTKATVSYQANPKVYDAYCYSTFGPKAASYSTAKLGPSLTQGGETDFYKLTDDVDIMVIVDLYNGSSIAPYKDVYTTGATGAEDTGITTMWNSTYGGKGRVGFKLRRNIIGGALVIPGGVTLIDVYRYATAGMPSPIPVIRLITEASIVPIPIECKINSGYSINVAFGDIDSTKITTSHLTSLYKKEIGLQYKCNTSLTQSIKVQMVATPASFNRDAIKTSNDDIGIIMTYNNTTVKPNESFRSWLSSGQGTDNVTFSVVGNNGIKPKTGAFTGSATLVMTSL